MRVVQTRLSSSLPDGTELRKTSEMIMDSKRTMARNILARNFGLPRTTANILVDRWSDDEVSQVVSKPIGEVNSVLAGITPSEFIPQSIQEEFAAMELATTVPPKPETVKTQVVESKPTPAEQM